MTEEDLVITNTHDKILEIFNKVKKEFEIYPKYGDFKKRFSDLVKQSFPRLEENRLVHVQQVDYDQEFQVDFVVNTIPVKVTEDIHGIGSSIMMGVLSHLSCRIGIVVNVVDGYEPEFITVQNQ